MNALKHGLTAKSEHAQEFIEKQSRAHLDRIHSDFIRKYRPASPEQEELVRKMVGYVKSFIKGSGMLRRMAEQNPKLKHSPSYQKLVEHQRMLNIHFNHAEAELKRQKLLHLIKCAKRTQNTRIPVQELEFVLRQLR